MDARLLARTDADELPSLRVRDGVGLGVLRVMRDASVFPPNSHAVWHLLTFNATLATVKSTSASFGTSVFFVTRSLKYASGVMSASLRRCWSEMPYTCFVSIAGGV